MPFKHNKALPLELFDNPETEVVSPEERIKNQPSGQPGALARSRFYDSRGEFAWAPCFVIAYDRYTNPVKAIKSVSIVSVNGALQLLGMHTTT